MSTKGKAARTTTPGTASKTLTTQPHFTALHRAWAAIISVAQRHAIDALLLANSVALLLALAAVLGGVQ